jgi:hypothetical protein
MAVRTDQPQIAEPIVESISIYVIEFKWNEPALPSRPSTSLTPSLL